MKEEIKEILDYIDDRIIPNEKWNKIKDQITNLQKENEKLKEKLNCKEYFSSTMPENTEFVILTKENYDRQQKDIELELIDYKQRNEKAIEYIIENCVLSDEWKDLGFCNFIPTGRIEYKQLSSAKVKELLNILKGGKL